VAVSDAYLQATMTQRDGIVGKGLFDAFPENPEEPAPSGAPTLRSSLARVQESLVADTMAIQKYDIRRPEADGGGFEVRYWSPVNSPVIGPDGGLQYIIHRVEDVTEYVRTRNLDTDAEIAAVLASDGQTEAEILRRTRDIAATNRELARANLELRRSQIFLDSVVENIPGAVFVKEAAELRFVRLNRAEEELIGRTNAEVAGKTDHDFFPREQADFYVQKDREALSAGQIVDISEEPIDTPTHGRRILHTKKIPILDEAGRPLYLVGISEDITERKAAENDLLAARLEADRANRAKTDFLSQMSHELRTPLTAILGFSQLLEMDELSVDQRTSVGHILQAGRHLLDLINEILDISRIETGQMTISLEPVALEELLDEVTAVVGPMAFARSVSVARATSCGAHVLADRQRLRQVFLNIVSNALKYNREGGTVTIGCDRIGGDRLRISIADTGYGIAPEHLDRVFHPFDRLGAELGTVEGTGLGLSLARGLVRAMGGTIAVESEIDAGTTFTIELVLTEGPIERYERSLERSGVETDGYTQARGRRTVLQIEDNASNVNLVERIMQRRPEIKLMTANDGRRGVELARTQAPDLILLDLHLPDMPGHEVLRELRTYPETREIPVVVVSADATDAQVARLTSAGVFGYLTKPLDVAKFLNTVDRAVHGDPTAAADVPS
jgi:PAS domain S-box-containing protein